MFAKYHKLIWWAILSLVFFVRCDGGGAETTAEKEQSKKEPFVLRSPAFADGDSIPVKYTCDGKDVSPPLKWDNPPSGTRSFALICDDPDAPMGTWVHWVLFNIPANQRSLPEDFAMPRDNIKATKPGKIVEGINDFRQLGYGGPCPPGGPSHRYYFKLYALDSALPLKTGAEKDDVEEAMKGHVLGEAVLVGKYKRLAATIE